MMPTHDSVWLDDDQGTAPARPESREQSPDEAVSFSKAKPSFLSLVDRELMPRRINLKQQVGAVGKHSADAGTGGPNGGEHLDTLGSDGVWGAHSQLHHEGCPQTTCRSCSQPIPTLLPAVETRRSS